VGAYDGIRVAGHYEVTLVSGNEGKLELQGAEKERSWLNSWNSKKVSIKVPVEHISKANLSGSGSIQSDMTLQGSHFENVISGSGTIQLKLDTQTLKGKVTGSGHLVLSGTANQVEFNVTGSGKISAERVNTKDGKASITGSGDIHMYSSNSLEANITGSGDLLCLGSPERQKTNVTGSGDIEIRN